MTAEDLELYKLLGFSDEEISKMGYEIVKEPKWIEEIIYAIYSY